MPDTIPYEMTTSDDGLGALALLAALFFLDVCLITVHIFSFPFCFYQNERDRCPPVGLGLGLWLGEQHKKGYVITSRARVSVFSQQERYPWDHWRETDWNTYVETSEEDYLIINSMISIDL